MHVIPVKWRVASARLLRGLAAPALLACGGMVLASEPQVLPLTVAAAPAHSQVVVPDIATARQLALEHQPSVQAARASLSAAQIRRQSLDSLGLVSNLLARDLAIRKEQSDLGVAAATAAVHQAEADAIFAVTYCYLAYEYASMQEGVAAEATKRTKDLSDLIDLTVEANRRRDVFKEHTELAIAVTEVVKGRAVEAKTGKRRALAALHEALGLGQECDVVVPDRALPEIKAELTQDSIVAAALARRGEVTQANVGAAVTRLEIDAQKKSWLPAARTFAVGSDLHYVPIPPANLGTNYRPGGITIEMPSELAGKRGCRVKQATELSSRADAVADKTRNLIALEAEDAFLRWEETGMVARHLAVAGKKADLYYIELVSSFKPKPEQKGIDHPTIEDLVGAGSAVGKIKADANEAFFNHLVALALLERVTGGGVCVNFDQPPPKVGK